MSISKKLISYKPIWKIASLFEQTEIIEEGSEKFVEKSYIKPNGMIKWLLLNFPIVWIYYPISTDPLERLKREVSFFDNPPKGIRVPKVMSVDYGKFKLTREFIEGRALSASSIDDVKKAGLVLGKLHSQSYCIGDPRPQNFIELEKGEVAVIDAEQGLVNCQKKTNKHWDVLLFFLFVFWDNPIIEPEEYSQRIRAFIEAYNKIYEKPSWNEMKLIYPISILIPPSLLLIIKNELS